MPQFSKATKKDLEEIDRKANKNDPSRLRVCHKQCDQCLFSKDKIVSDYRKKTLLEDIAKKKTYFICHKASMTGHKVMCRGFYEKNKDSSLQIILGHFLKAIDFIDVKKLT